MKFEIKRPEGEGSNIGVLWFAKLSESVAESVTQVPEVYCRCTYLDIRAKVMGVCKAGATRVEACLHVFHLSGESGLVVRGLSLDRLVSGE